MKESYILVHILNIKYEICKLISCKTPEKTHEEVKYSCKDCSYNAIRNKSPKEHLKSVHEGIKYPCKDCNYEATTKGNLEELQKSAH